MAFEKRVLEEMRRAVRIYPNKAELLRKIGSITKKALYDFIDGSTPRIDTLNAIAAALGLDPVTGLPLGTVPSSTAHAPPPRTIPARVMRQPRAGGIFGEDLQELPASLDLTEAEARLILSRRETTDGYAVFKVIRDEADMGRAYLPQGDALARSTLKSIGLDAKAFLARREKEDDAAKERKK